MKKFIIAAGIVLTSGIAAFALTNNKHADNTTAEIKASKAILEKNTAPAGSVKSDLAVVD